ncbi:hypothetical protein BJF79_09700 [Actinomadura sp. CNU-125]|nr:hypothetical protein BJF79_09700 [Actinomadura sp. CNU-125]
MLARERTETYRVDMSKQTTATQPEPRAATWRNECLNTEVDDWKTGVIKDRKHFCTHADLMISTFNPETALPGVVWFTLLVYGTGSTGSGSQRYFDLNLELLNVRSDEDFPWHENMPIYASIPCKVQIPASVQNACETNAIPVGRTIEQWQESPHISVPLWSSDATVSDPSLEPQVGEEKVVMISFSPTVTSVSPAFAPVTPSTQADPDVIPTVSMNGYARFDSAKYLSTGFGAIFRGVVPHISYDPASPRYKELAEHIRDACDPDVATFPTPVPDKAIPGCSINDLIHRLAPAKWGWPKPATIDDSNHKKRYDRNRAIVRSNCNDNTPETPSTGDKECDEFPFASTYEGAARAEFPASEFAGLKNSGRDNQFSVRKINGQQNGWGGSDLNTWYNNDRILDWATGGSSSTHAAGDMRDGFWVRIP